MPKLEQKTYQEESNKALVAQTIRCQNEPYFNDKGEMLYFKQITKRRVELIEVQFINTIAPFMLNSKFENRFIVNVSSMEGQFNRENKTKRHPHTNMAKASLNMMTRTSAQDYAKENIYMNSIDTG